MGFNENLLALFKSNAAKLLVLLALTGIALTAYPVYEGLYKDTEKKIDLIKKWKDIGGKPLAPETLDIVYNQLSLELANNNGRLETAMSIFGQQAPQQSPLTFIVKFLTGGLLYFFVYGVMMIFYLYKHYDPERIINLLKRYSYIFFIWLGMSIINLLIPFISISVNYIFIPSCLSLIAAVISFLWNIVNPDSEIQRLS